MPDLLDGQSVEVQGTARVPYVIKNVGGVYTCTCPAWKFQSRGLEQRSCKHIRSIRGDEAERQRVGDISSCPRSTKTAKAIAPPLLLAQTWDESTDPCEWWMSEKLDGVRAFWTSSGFQSRYGNVFHAPAWFCERLPAIPLDGELWIERKSFQRTVGIVRRHDQSEDWRHVRFVIFDAPEVAGSFETRQAFLQSSFCEFKSPFARVLEQERCQGISHLYESLAQVEAVGGEGLMLRQPGSCYEPGRSTSLLKVKSFHEMDVRVVEHLPGTGRHHGRLGALGVLMTNGNSFSVSSGLTDAQRDAPPPIGTIITVKYQELTDGGIPRFPSFVRVRSDLVTTSS